MKAKMLLVAVLILAVSTAAFCQLNWKPKETTYALTDKPPTDPTAVAIPTGAANLVYLFHDLNSNHGTPPCTYDDTTAVTGTTARMFNRNTTYIGAGGQPAGKFNPTTAFTTVGQCPVPVRFYFVTYYPPLSVTNPPARIKWVSQVLTPICPGGSQPEIPDDWCYIYVINCQADNPAETVFNGAIHAPIPDPDRPELPTDALQFDCITVCAGGSHTVMVGPLADITRVPHIVITPGCLTCEPPSSCTPGGALVEHGWVLSTNGRPGGPADGTIWYSEVLSLEGVGGCFCIHFDHILAVELSNIKAEVGDAEVNLSWGTASETGWDKYVITRNGVKLPEVKANGGATEANYSYLDKDVANGTTYHYVITAYGVDGNVKASSEVEATPSYLNITVKEYALKQNFPNPFNPSTMIAIDVKNTNPVTLKVYNAMGQEVATLLDHVSVNGGTRYPVTFDASNLTSGLYFYTVKIGNEFSATKKMLLVK